MSLHCGPCQSCRGSDPGRQSPVKSIWHSPPNSVKFEPNYCPLVRSSLCIPPGGPRTQCLPAPPARRKRYQSWRPPGSPSTRGRWCTCGPQEKSGPRSSGLPRGTPVTERTADQPSVRSRQATRRPKTAPRRKGKYWLPKEGAVGASLCPNGMGSTHSGDRATNLLDHRAERHLHKKDAGAGPT